MWILLALIGGILAGIVVTSAYFWTKTIGALRVDHSDPSEPPYLFLDVNANLKL